MQTIHATTKPVLRTARHFALACLLPAMAMGVAHAESSTEAQANYQKQRAECLSGQSSEGQKTCLREAAAALNDAKRGTLDKNNANFEQNATARCQVFKNEDDRSLCERRVREGIVSGSVAGGGEIRELTVTVPADDTQSMPQQPDGIAPAN